MTLPDFLDPVQPPTTADDPGQPATEPDTTNPAPVLCDCGCGFTTDTADKLTRSAIPHHRAADVGITPAIEPADFPDAFGSLRGTLIQSYGALLTGRDDSGAVSLCVRPDVPVITTKNGKEHAVKYVNASGDGTGVPLWRLTDAGAGADILMVEGMLQSRSVAVWAPEELTVVGMNGCRGWAKRDLSFVSGSRVCVFLDKDRNTNADVRAAALSLEEELFRVKARDVLFVDLPDSDEASSTDGPDDYLGRLDDGQRTAFVRSLVDTASHLAHPGADAFEAALYDSKRLDDIEPPVALIPGWLTKNSLARLVGEPGTGKSFVALEWAAAVGSGGMYEGKTAAKGEVLYVVAEGTSGIQKRVRAWEKHNGRVMEGVFFYPAPVQIMGSGGDGSHDSLWKSMVALARRRKFSLIVLDTQSRVTVGVEENSNTEMGRVVDRLDDLRARSGACVLLVHHTSKGGDTGRGAGVVTGALQSEFMLTRSNDGEGKVLKLENTKEKDEADGSTRYLRMEVIQVVDGDPKNPFIDVVTSVVLVDAEPEDGSKALEEEVKRRIPDSENAFRERMDKLYARGPGGSRAEIRNMALVGDEKEGLDKLFSKNTFTLLWGRLFEEGLILQVGTTQKFKVAPPGMTASAFMALHSKDDEDE